MAHLLALKKLDEKKELVYNLGNSKGHSVKEVIEAVREISGKDFKVTNAARRAGDSPILTSDASKARGELSWTPKFGDLESIIKTAWEWHNKYPDGYED